MTVEKQPTTTTTPAKIRVIQADRCSSLSGRTSIDFQVGCNESERIFIRVQRTSGNGFFSKEWVPYDSIGPLLVNPVTAASLRPIFQGKSVNTSGFLLAVMKHLGFVQSIPEAFRGYQVLDNPAFDENTKKLIADGVDLTDELANTNGGKAAGKGKGGRKKLEKVD
jgi:hypothetical protein